MVRALEVVALLPFCLIKDSAQIQKYFFTRKNRENGSEMFLSMKSLLWVFYCNQAVDRLSKNQEYDC